MGVVLQESLRAQGVLFAKVLALENLLNVVPFLLVFAQFSLYVPTHTHSQNHAKDLISLAS